MRVSDNMRIDAVTRNVTAAQTRQLAASKEASSGQRIGAPSDDPVGAAQLARVQASIETTAGFRSAIKSVNGDLTLAEGTLADATSVFERAQEIALQGANGSLSASERSTLATEVGGLREQLASLANTKGST